MRSLDHPQALRIASGTPRQPDNQTVPIHIEVPVDLHASLDDGQTHRDRGWYRLRRNPVTSRWELTAASLAPVIR